MGKYNGDTKPKEEKKVNSTDFQKKKKKKFYDLQNWTELRKISYFVYYVILIFFSLSFC